MSNDDEELANHIDFSKLTLEELFEIHKHYAFQIKSLKQKIRLMARNYYRQNKIPIVRSWKVQ